MRISPTKWPRVFAGFESRSTRLGERTVEQIRSCAGYSCCNGMIIMVMMLMPRLSLTREIDVLPDQNGRSRSSPVSAICQAIGDLTTFPLVCRSTAGQPVLGLWLSLPGASYVDCS